MSYLVNGHEITVNFPVDSISVNKSSIAFTDSQGKNRQTFSKRTEALKFMNWLLSSSK
ncbi:MULTISPECIES: hypothetical protein [Shewanella]|jgi:hypothetical protein|uniref:Uncharacterized protein n=1 Tax=Shewanella piezotolerans (strain WP3 / JCM 13877) TaxID=225849 RepID=B8CPK7_SHEPW|nr:MULTISPECIES: hypothetical protein [Shewanella]PKG56928.1 hypothetical protein CXF82_12000 [Shewanella sp. GutDb-MelDb]PKG72654.1 hypothetical protein CXF86_22245 [Shewanella sp. GutCb]PKH56966.1 hypothetical protein CXF84_10845 [Shewanella sp. Bg11-22]PKI27763.1 hypothetical protein CXF83_14135 [Shewanella sp. Choline-02u-19]ACJ29583.1 Conserved hypothetical protein [Shewanella piezotolerans WP3]